MSFELAAHHVARMIDFVDQMVREQGCDHSRRYCAQWAEQNGFDWDDLRDALDCAGAFCDCEAVLNIEDGPLLATDRPDLSQNVNPWLLPAAFNEESMSLVSKILVSRPALTKSAFTKDGEWLVPAPADAKPRKRVRKLVHFFIGTETGLPSEVGFVTEISPMPIRKFVETITNSSVPELRNFDRRVASFLLAKIANLSVGTPVGTDLAERIGIASKHRELNIHRVILRK